MNRAVFFASLRKSFGKLKKGQVEGIERILDYWQAEWPKMPIEELAYVLATVKWETGNTFQPIEEGEPKLKGAKLDAYQQTLWYWPWFGRGLVQITHKANYDKFNITITQALEWPTALRVLFEGMIKGMFTGKKLADYISVERQNYKGARAVVNGNDKDDEIASFAIKFLSALRAAMDAPDEIPAATVSPAAKTGGTVAGGTLIAAGAANAGMGGSDWASAASILAGLASAAAPWIIERFKKPAAPVAAPKPPPPSERDTIDAPMAPLDITHSETAAYDAAKAHRLALESELSAAREAEEKERMKVVARAKALLTAIGIAPATDAPDALPPAADAPEFIEGLS